MSQVKRLKALGIEYADPRIWQLLEDLDNLPEYLANKETERLAREKFVEKVWGEAIAQMEAIRKDK